MVLIRERHVYSEKDVDTLDDIKVVKEIEKYKLDGVFEKYRYMYEDGGELVWQSDVELRDDMRHKNGEHINFVYMDSLMYTRRFRKNVERSCKELVDVSLRFAKENDVKVVEMKFCNEIPEDVVEGIKSYSVPGVEYNFLGFQWVQIQLQEQTG